MDADGWRITIDVATPEPALDASVDALRSTLGAREGCVEVVDETRLRVAFSVTEVRSIDPAWEAAIAGDRAWEEAAVAVGFAGAAVISLQARRDDDLGDVASPRPTTTPELFGVAEVARLLGVSRRRAYELEARGGFPEPYTVLASGPVWDAASVERFVAARGRRPAALGSRAAVASIFVDDGGPVGYAKRARAARNGAPHNAPASVA